jgi:hypothetical protein
MFAERRSLPQNARQKFLQTGLQRVGIRGD